MLIGGSVVDYFINSYICIKIFMFDLKKGIRTPLELLQAIEIAAKNYGFDDIEYAEAIWAIHKYKWYNWYQNLHIKKDTPEDIENTKIFKSIEIHHPNIHRDVEANITHEITKLEDDYSL